MMQMVILVLVLGIKMVKTRNQPMEEEDGVQSKGTDEVRQQLHQNYCCDIPGNESLFLWPNMVHIIFRTAKYRPGGEDHNTPKNFVLWGEKFPQKGKRQRPSSKRHGNAGENQ